MFHVWRYCSFLTPFRISLAYLQYWYIKKEFKTNMVPNVRYYARLEKCYSLKPQNTNKIPCASDGRYMFMRCWLGGPQRCSKQMNKKIFPLFSFSTTRRWLNLVTETITYFCCLLQRIKLELRRKLLLCQKVFTAQEILCSLLGENKKVSKIFISYESELPGRMCSLMN